MAQTIRRRKYQAGFKLNVIAYAKKHNNCAAAREYAVTEKVVRDWRIKEDILKKIPKSKCTMRRGNAHWPNLENYLADIVCEHRKNGYGISRNKIRNMALEWAKENQEDCKNFKATASWCGRFMERHNLVLRKRTILAKKLPTEIDTEITHTHHSKIMQRKKSNYFFYIPLLFFIYNICTLTCYIPCDISSYTLNIRRDGHF